MTMCPGNLIKSHVQFISQAGSACRPDLPLQSWLGAGGKEAAGAALPAPSTQGPTAAALPPHQGSRNMLKGSRGLI